MDLGVLSEQEVGGVGVKIRGRFLAWIWAVLEPHLEAKKFSCHFLEKTYF
jgi:hypothetical protein